MSARCQRNLEHENHETERNGTILSWTGWTLSKHSTYSTFSGTIMYLLHGFRPSFCESCVADEFNSQVWASNRVWNCRSNLWNRFKICFQLSELPGSSFPSPPLMQSFCPVLSGFGSIGLEKHKHCKHCVLIFFLPCTLYINTSLPGTGWMLCYRPYWRNHRHRGPLHLLQAWELVSLPKLPTFCKVFVLPFWWCRSRRSPVVSSLKTGPGKKRSKAKLEPPRETQRRHDLKTSHLQTHQTYSNIHRHSTRHPRAAMWFAWSLQCFCYSSYFSHFSLSAGCKSHFLCRSPRCHQEEPCGPVGKDLDLKAFCFNF